MLRDIRTMLRLAFLGLFAIALSAVSAQAEDPSRQWVGVTGMISSCNSQGIVLSHGNGSAQIDLGAMSWCASLPEMSRGGVVSVYGFADMTAARPLIRSVAIYVHEENAIYAGTRIDRKTGKTVYGDWIPTRDRDPLNAIGMVLKVSGQEFHLDTGQTVLSVDTGKMSFDPMDPNGILKLREGDVISIEGYVDGGPFLRHEIQARRIVKLSGD